MFYYHKYLFIIKSLQFYNFKIIKIKYYHRNMKNFNKNISNYKKFKIKHLFSQKIN